MPELLSQTMPGAFAMLTIGAPDGPVRRALRSGEIELADLGVLLLLVDAVKWESCRFWGSAADLAAAVGEDPATIEVSLARLQRAGLVAHGLGRRKPRRRFWCVLPAVATTGGRGRRQAQWLTFVRALEDQEIEESTPLVA